MLSSRSQFHTTAPLSYTENYDRSQTDLDQEALGRPALPEGRAPYEVTEHGSFRDRLNTGRCGGERCPLNHGEQRRRNVKFTQKHLLEPK